MIGLALLAFPALTGCPSAQSLLCDAGICGAPTAPSDQPGSYSFYSFTSFANGVYNGSVVYSNLCFSTSDPTCINTTSTYFSQPLSQGGWKLVNGVSQGLLNGAYIPSSETTAPQIINEHANLLYVNSHGSLTNGQALICLQDCDAANDWGATYSWGTAILPQSWHGPNWLIVDACDVIQPGYGWEAVFGGSLHGILGWNQDVTGLQSVGQSALVKSLIGFDTALDAWETATAATNFSTAASALIPPQNATDSIEATGGPKFGSSGDAFPNYYQIVSGSLVATVGTASLASAPSAAYSLIPEQMNESYWNSYYGGSSVPSVVSHPTSNEDMYRNENVIVDHYLASGGLVVAAERTGTAKGFSESDAYSYATSWLASNGGLPTDAALTFAGAETVTPAPSQATSDQPYPSNTEYVFIWRHASSAVVGNDKIELRIDDAGALTKKSITLKTFNIHCNCYVTETEVENVAPWVPVFHVHTYVRSWRALGSAIQTGYRNALSFDPGAYGYCSSTIDNPNSRALPCAVITEPNGGHQFVDTQSGVRVSSSE